MIGSDLESIASEGVSGSVGATLCTCTPNKGITQPVLRRWWQAAILSPSGLADVLTSEDP